jgi:DNA polymerase-3 subunit alpha
LKELNVTELSALEGRRNGEELLVAGIAAGVRAMRSKKGARWAILTLQDMTGTVEVLVFPESFTKHEALLHGNARLVIKGRISIEDVGTRIILSDVKPLEEFTEGTPTLLRVRLSGAALDEDQLERLQDLFERNRGSCRVDFELVREDGSVVEVESECRVRPDRELIARVQEICGPEAVEVLR